MEREQPDQINININEGGRNQEENKDNQHGYVPEKQVGNATNFNRESQNSQQQSKSFENHNEEKLPYEDELESKHYSSFKHYAENSGFEGDLEKLFTALGNHDLSRQYAELLMQIIWDVQKDQYQKTSLIQSLKGYSQGNNVKLSNISHNIAWTMRERVKTDGKIRHAFKFMINEIIKDGVDDMVEGIGKIAPAIREVLHFFSSSGQNDKLLELTMEALADNVKEGRIPSTSPSQVFVGNQTSPAYKMAIDNFNRGYGNEVGMKLLSNNGGKFVVNS